MERKVRDALIVLGFDSSAKLPKLKEIRKRFLKLSVVHHPDRNKGKQEATQRFQEILHAYEVAGKACEDIIYDDDDQEDVLARKMFKQFSFSAIKENSTTFTIKTELPLNSLWKQVLEANFGPPDDLGSHGLKYTAVDKCDSMNARIFITIYTKGKMLTQNSSDEPKHH